MKVKFEFDLSGENEFDEEYKLSQTMSAVKALRSLNEISNMLRDRYKYPEKYNNEEDQLKSIMESFQDILNDNGIDLDELYR